MFFCRPKMPYNGRGLGAGDSEISLKLKYLRVHREVKNKPSIYKNNKKSRRGR
jgi:hypothetical protein